MSLDPKDIFGADWSEIYKIRMRALHLQMSEIMSTFYIYESIVKFPFHLFGEFHDLSPTIFLLSSKDHVVRSKRAVVDPAPVELRSWRENP